MQKFHTLADGKTITSNSCLKNFSQIFEYDHPFLAKRFYNFLKGKHENCDKQRFIEICIKLKNQDKDTLERLTIAVYDGKEDQQLTADEIDELLNETTDRVELNEEV